MPNTPNLSLIVTDDENQRFDDWRKDINAVDNSNTQKIDVFAGKFVGGAANQYYRKKSTAKFDGGWETPDSSPTQSSNKLITSGAVEVALVDTKAEIESSISSKDNASRITIAENGDVSQTLLPDVFYAFSGNLSSLTLAFTDEVVNRENEYKGQFLSGESSPMVTFPLGIRWIGEGPTIEPGKVYQFSVLNNIGIIVGL